MTAIAIVGMACRFADAPDLHAFWQMTREGRDAFSPIPPDRWDERAFFSTNKRAKDRSYAPHGAFIQDVRSFPALHLGIPPRRVEVLDPQQRFSLEVSLQAIEDAGYGPGEMPRRTGVYIGVTASEYRTLVSARLTAALMASGAMGDAPEDASVLADSVSQAVASRPFSAPGVLANMCAAVVTQELDLHGPAFTTDAACASALVALDNAVTQLRSGAIDAAIAGGVYLCLTPENHVAFSRIGAISGTGYCRPFDHRADGFVQGDGAGAVVLKRLDDAQRDGDRIYAVIRGIALNNDGRGDGPMAPIEAGQADVICRAWAGADISPTALGYVETHGTGTAVGDATEIRALQRALGSEAGLSPAWLGSSKANIGHTMSAAGIAGIIRAALAIHHQTIPPMAGFESPREGLDLASTRFSVPTEALPWEQEHRVAAVSSFGFGGTNGHCVLESGEPSTEAFRPQPELVLISAPDESTLRALAARTAATLRVEPGASVAGVAASWSIRAALAARLAIVASTVDELIEALEEAAEGRIVKGAAMGIAPDAPPRIGFLFPGQGAQRAGMLHDIGRRFPIVQQTLSRLERTIEDRLALPLTDLLYPDRRDRPVPDHVAAEQLTATQHCQPVMFACSESLRCLLQSVGIEPVVAAGHSLGEFNAAVAADMVDAQDALSYVVERGAAMAAVPGDCGAMAAFMATVEDVEPLLVPGAVIANYNHPRQQVVSGTSEAIAAVLANAEHAQVIAKPLDVSHAFHSALFEDVTLDDAVSALPLREASIPVASGIIDTPYRATETARDVFRRHAGSPVRFTEALQQCLDVGVDLLLQVGAGGPLASFARKTAGREVRAVLSLSGMKDNDQGHGLLATLGWLFVHGAPIDITSICGDAPVSSVPPSVLPRETYWAIKDTRQRRLELTNIAPSDRPAPAPPPVEAPTGTEGTEGTEEERILEQVAAVVARVSSYPRAAIRDTSTLVDDLGFDSLMVGDMATGLAEAFPGLGGLPQELLINRPTVGDIAAYVQMARGGPVAEIDDDAPLRDVVPDWRPCPLPDRPRAPDAWELGGPGRWPELGQGMGTGALVWVADLADPIPVDAVIAAEAGWVDTATPFLVAVSAGGPRDVLVVRRDDDPWGEALAGAVRSLAREWPDRHVKCIAVDASDLPAPGKVLAELTSDDRTVDVRLSSSERHVLGTHEAMPAARLPDASDRIAISGGTRGIGLKLARVLRETGAVVYLLGRSAPEPEVAAWIKAEDGGVHAVAVDVTDRDAVMAALDGLGITGVVHAAGVLADGPVEAVSSEVGARARAVKATGLLHLLAATTKTAQWAIGIGSWAGRFGNRHQTHYGAANALLAALAKHSRIPLAVAEFGPWTGSEMVQTIPAAVRAAMRAEGVDFVGDTAGLDALIRDIGQRGPIIHGRNVPHTTRIRSLRATLSTETHPYLLDHAINGVPVLPLASAADLIAHAADLEHPFEVTDLTLFRGITVSEATTIEVAVRGERAEIRVGDDRVLAYRAGVRPARPLPELPTLEGDIQAAELTLEAFYRDVTFHGPLLRGLTAIDGVGVDGTRGRVRAGRPDDWIPHTARQRWTIDPLALDSAFQLSATVAWTRYRRAGTPVSLQRFVQLAPMPDGEIAVEALFGESSEDRFCATFIFRDASGAPVAVAFDAVAEMRAVDDDTLEIKPEWIDPSTWEPVRDLEVRLEAAAAIGVDNPFFKVHQGTARDTTVVGDRELVNFSSYNYIGLSGDPRVLTATKEAVDRYGTSVSASRVASGERPFHKELEQELAAAQGAEDALVFTAGHATNVTTIGHLMQPGDLVLHDELIHDSAMQGIKLSGAGRRGFRHDDPDHLEQLLRELRAHHDKVLIVVEGVYSMDGDICALPRFIELKRRYGCLLMVDEAHSFGVVGATGCGVREHFGIDGREVDIWMGTLSKSLASCGGWIAASAPLVRYLRYTAPGFVYSAGLTAANGVAALTALRLMREEPERVEKLQQNARRFHEALVTRGVDTGPARGASAVIPAVTGNSAHALFLSERLLAQGVNVQPIVYPAVADDAARLRFFLSSTHTTEQLDETAEQVATTLAQVRADFPMP